MSSMIQEKNKALVLKAFDTLFNKRDYAAALRFWSPNYMQHSAHIGRGVKDYSAWSRACHRRSGTNRERSLQTRSS
jgi:predicted SnoaL-like aldol condensation-catalyzing enzyme